MATRKIHQNQKVKRRLSESLSSDAWEEIREFSLDVSMEIFNLLDENPAFRAALESFNAGDRAAISPRVKEALRTFDTSLYLALFSSMGDLQEDVAAAIDKMARDEVREYGFRGERVIVNAIKKKVTASVKALQGSAAPYAESAARGEGPPDGPLGRWVFSKNRLDSVPKDEEDTDYEEHIYNNLRAYVTSNEPIAKDGTMMLRDIISSGDYRKIFHPPDGGTKVYRGMNVEVKFLKKALGSRFDELVELDANGDVKTGGSWEGSFVYTPLYGDTSSWSTSENAVKDFMIGEDTPIMLVASTDDNERSFYDLIDLYDVKPMNRFSREKEVMGMGPINVEKIVWKGKGARKLPFF